MAFCIYIILHLCIFYILLDQPDDDQVETHVPIVKVTSFVN